MRALPFPLAALLVLLTFSACGKKAANTGAPPPRPVTATRAVTRDVPLYIDEIGTVTASEYVNVQSQVAGQITEIHFQDGADVKQGDVLFTIDSRAYQAALDKAKATLAQNTAKHDFQRVQMARMDDLKTKKVASSQDYDQARSTLVEQEAILQADKAAVATAQLNVEFCTIRAPITGRAGKRLVDRGNIVAYPGGPSLVTITRQDPLFIDFSVAEEKLPAVRAYQARGTLSLEAWFASDPKKRRVGEFSFVDNAISSGNGTVRLRGRLPNEDRMFWPGQFINVRLVLDTAKDAVMIPTQALQTGQIGTFVFVVGEDNKATIRPVRPGQRQGNEIVIEDGVKSGENVVLTGQLYLAPGTAVKIVIPPGSPEAAQAETETPKDKEPM